MRPLGDRRIRVRFEVVGSLNGTLEVLSTARVVNISAGGALLETKTALPVGSVQMMHIDLGGQPQRVTGRVRRLEKAEWPATAQHYAVGVEFLAPSPALSQSLAELVAEVQAD